MYDNGDEKIAKTNGWTINGTGNKDNNRLYITKRTVVYTNNMIDLSKYSKLYIKYLGVGFDGINNHDAGYLEVASTTDATIWAASWQPSSYPDAVGKSITERTTTDSIDVSSVNTSLRVRVGTNQDYSRSVTIESIWLE